MVRLLSACPSEMDALTGLREKMKKDSGGARTWATALHSLSYQVGMATGIETSHLTSLFSVTEARQSQVLAELMIFVCAQGREYLSDADRVTR
uniref:Prophage antirepressor n=1 Tax=Mesocestoides corti TaxID=53468 RepID=A0A5K3ET76_MESCO